MVPNDIHWPLAPANLSLGVRDVHVWAANLDVTAKSLIRLRSILSEDELLRAGRLHFDTHRNRFVAGRGILRMLLGKYLECAVDELNFTYGPNGKPALAGRNSQSGLFFNLAHSEDIALFVFTHVGPIGIDVERIRPVSD